MAERPWMKFYPADWQADQLLGMCSLAARGLWMEMLAIMHRAEPYGHLLVNGKKPSDEQLAALARAPADQIRAYAHELEQAGVLSRTRNGTIYSRRMTRDEKRRKDGEQSAKQGRIKGSRRNRQVAEKADENLPAPRGPVGVVEQPPSAPEAICSEREEKEKTEERGAAAPAEHPAMAFAGKVIRLNRADYDRWAAAFSYLHLPSELQNRDDWLAAQPQGSVGNWFISTSNYLKARNEDARQKATAPKRPKITPFGVGG